jgi:penicillin amidase
LYFLKTERQLTAKARIIIGSLFALLLILVAATVFLSYQIRKSFPETSGTLSVAGLEERVTVSRDGYGVPHIAAANEHDLMFAIGYAHAQDRLWQMDLSRRAGAGRLSEIFGPSTVPFDRMFRIVGIQRISEEIEKSISPASRNRLQWYADGVNSFITSHKGKYPAEFDLLRYDPDQWEPVHSIIIGRMMSWELNLAWWTDLTYGAILDRVGQEKMREILPTYPNNVEPIVPSTAWRAMADLQFLKTAESFQEFMGSQGALGGSNAWVIAPSRSASGKVILANDTHLHLQCPSNWYELDLHAPGYDVSGMSIAGVPGIVAGQNKYIAWGLTNVMADDADFYIEKIDSLDPTKYIYDGQSLPIQFREEEIHVRGDSAVPVIIRSTHHGPIVTDINTSLKKAQYPFVASMRWTGSEISDQIEAFNAIDRATNWDEFIAGVRQFTGPGQNFVYGDIHGNIGYWCGVKLPIRGTQQGLLPLAGWTKDTEWKGFVPFNQLPHLFNPPEGFIATANNKIVDDAYPYHISDLWEPPSRIIRLREVLGRKDLFSVEDFERLQNDMFSYQAKDLVPYVLAACQDSALNDADGRLVSDYLRNWNYVFAKEDVATAIFQQFFVKLLENIYKDEMGEEVFHDFVILVNIPIRVTTKLVSEGTSSWFDDVRTEQVETRDDIIRKSLREAVAALKQRFGGEMKMWRWGDMHTVTLRHPFSLGLPKPLSRLFMIGPFPYGGGSTALMSGEYSYNAPFEVTVGASFRQIVDFSKPDEARRVLPAGQSGQVFHRHFEDQTQLWLNGAYRTVRLDSASATLESWEHLILEPARSP